MKMHKNEFSGPASVFGLLRSRTRRAGVSAAMLVAAAALVLPAAGGSALAQPVSNYMGIWPNGALYQQYFFTNVGPRQVSWYRIDIFAGTSASRYYDFLTQGSTIGDTEMALFDSNGGLLAQNDDWELGRFKSGLSFGQAYPKRAYDGFTKRFGGDSGNLSVGVYYIALAGYSQTTSFGRSGFQAFSASPFSGTLGVQVWTNSGIRTDPVVTGIANFEHVGATGTALLRAWVDPGFNPTSTGITVHADLSGIGGSSFALLNDSEFGGDAAADDGIWSMNYQVPVGTLPGTYTIPVSAYDLQGRSAAASSVTVTVVGPTDLGTLYSGNPTISYPEPISPGQVLWYNVTLGEGASAGRFVDMNTLHSDLTGGDTMLGLYAIDGTLLASNDDWDTGVAAPANFESMLTYGRPVSPRYYAPWNVLADGRTGTDLPAGQYRIAVTGYPATFENNFVVTTAHTRIGITTLNLFTGRNCSIADIVDGGGAAPGDGIVDGSDFVSFINSFAVGDTFVDPLADVNGDSVIDGNDFIEFINAFAAGC